MVRYLFTMALDSFHSSLSQLELDTFCNDYGIGEEFGSVLSGLNESIYDFPQGKIGIYTYFIEFANFRLPSFLLFILSALEHFRMHISQFTVLGASRISHFKIICRVHYDGDREFPRDHPVNEEDGDMILETLPNGNPTKIRSLISDAVNQEVGTAALPPHPSDAKNRAFAETPGEAYVFKKLKGTSKTSSGKALVLVLSIVSPPTSAAAAKVGEFVITSAPAKRLKSAVKGTDESIVGSSHDAVGLHDDSTSIEAGFEHLCSSMEITKATTFMHILGILLNMVEDSAKMPRHDKFYASMSVDPFVAQEIYHYQWVYDGQGSFMPELYRPSSHSQSVPLSLFFDTRAWRGGLSAAMQLFWKGGRDCPFAKVGENKSSKELAQLRLGKEEADREVIHP
ncbi:hypothetical protein Tco_1074090 [Tanacetum coccineum]